MNTDPEFTTETHQQTIDVATEFLHTLGRGDMETLMKLWHDNGRLEFPFSPTGEEPVEGIDQLRSYFEATQGYKKPYGCSIKAVIPAANPDCVVVEFHGDLIDTRTDELYDNEYIAIVRVRDRRVILFREFFDSLKRQKHAR